jgi:DNA-binding transcriptional ArsR family regulator
VRRPQAPFGWLEAHLLHDRWLQRLQPDATAVILLLALAADRRGASYYSRGRMADRLGIDVERVDRALGRLLDAGVVDLRPWRPGSRDGVWQLLPVERSDSLRSGKCMSVADLLRSLGVMPQPAP